MKKRSIVCSFIALLINFFLLVTSVASQELVHVTYMPHWMHQAQFAGYYMAVEKGIYEKYGLDVEILDGGPLQPMEKVFEDSVADFGSEFLSGAIKLCNKGVSIVNIAQLSQRSALLFVAKKKSGIVDVGDFNGKKIGIWRSGFHELPFAFLDKYDIRAEVIPITNTISLFLYGGVDIMCVMWYNEYHSIYDSGINFGELRPFFFSDYGLDIPEDGIYCRKSFYEENPEVCNNFVKATIEGWEYAFSHKDETIGVVLRIMYEHDIPANKSHQGWMLARMEDIFKNGSGKISGILKKPDYEKTVKILMQTDSVSRIESYEDFYKGKMK